MHEDSWIDNPQSSNTAISVAQAVDWFDIMDRAARDAMKRQEILRRRKTFTSVDRQERFAPSRKIERSEIPWDALGGKRVGLTKEGLFFVKLSNRCKIETVFIGCGFGGDPKPEGNLFKGLDAKLDTSRHNELP